MNRPREADDPGSRQLPGLIRNARLQSAVKMPAKTLVETAL